MVPFSPWRFFFYILEKCVVSVGSDSFCRDCARVIICPLQPRSSLFIGLPIWSDEVHGFLGVVFWTYLFSKKKSSGDGGFLR